MATRINAVMGEDGRSVFVTHPQPMDFDAVEPFLTWLNREHRRLLDAGESLAITTRRTRHPTGTVHPADRYLREQIGEGSCGQCLTD